MSAGMRLIHDWRDLGADAKGAAVALGAFDGVHRGHRAVIASAAAAARRLGAPLGVVTFEPHPRRFFDPEGEPFRVANADQQARAVADLGVDRLYRLPFDAELAALSDQDFARQVLGEGLGVSHVSAGSDITFGRGRSGNAAALGAYGEKFGFEVAVAPLLQDGGAKCSSTAIRAALTRGRPEEAAKLLGRPFAIEGVVVHGDHLGRTIGFPTANMALGDYVRPAQGIYAARTRLGDGREIASIAYIGRRPTVDGIDERLEVNLFDFDEDLYGQTLETDLIAFLRGDEKFSGLDAMKAQIARDCEAARAILLPAF
ncbi:MAG TPA: bifunctional riboflavin kinase/FAD synthetase [Caulobacteraceae bacterium]|jgi:riboflavin kinase/FMN adenylyltransferase|nr:bifunctional riboflavin kinase/FAD synthetase [Caulobacteraceae bacterium]